MLTEKDLKEGRVFPSMENIRNISVKVACEVIKAAADEGNLNSTTLMRALSKGDEALERYVLSRMYYPEYKSLVVSSAHTSSSSSNRH